MERLISTDRKTSTKKTITIEYIKDALIAIIIGVGTFMVGLTSYGISFNPRGGFGGSFTGGLVNTWNQMVDAIGKTDGTFLTKLVEVGGESQKFLWIILIIEILVSFFIVRSGNRWLALIYPLVFLIPTLFFGLHASVIWMAVMAFGLILFLIDAEFRRNPNMVSMEWRGLLYALIAMCIAFILISIPFVSDLADKPSAVKNADDAIGQSAIESYYGESPLGDGDLTMTARPAAQGTALEVTMSDAQPMYLRGFVGDVLDGNQWKTLPNSAYYNSRDLMFWLSDSGFNGMGQIGQVAELAVMDDTGTQTKAEADAIRAANEEAKKAQKQAEKKAAADGTTVDTKKYKKQKAEKKNYKLDYNSAVENEITIKTKNTSSRYAYIPYEITSAGISEDKAQNWGDSFITGGKLKKLTKYSYSSKANAVSKWTDIAGRFFTEQHSMDATLYLQNESFYNTYVYDHFRTVSEKDRETLNRFVGDNGDQTQGHVDYTQAIQNVKDFLMMHITYDENYGKTDKKQTALENILNKGKGYDSQYATVAVMLFRYYGIPARYVEGYLVTEQDAVMAENTGGAVSVSQNAAHAWPEIYVDGIGFVPVEVCPTYSGRMPEADYSVGITNKTLKEHPDNTQDWAEDPVDEGKDNDYSNEKVPSIVMWILAIIMGLMILALLVLATVLIVKGIGRSLKRRREFRKGVPKDAVRAIYKHMEEKEIPSDDITRDLGNKATYSVYPISEGDRQTMLARLKQIKKKTRKQRAAGSLAMIKGKVKGAKVNKPKIKKPKIGRRSK